MLQTMGAMCQEESVIMWAMLTGAIQVKYFKQKRVADYNKEQQLLKLEKEGAVPVGTATEKSSWKPW